jgi:hypothetical protein
MIPASDIISLEIHDVHVSYLPCMPHVSPVSSSLINYPDNKYMVKGTNHEAPHVIFSILLLFPLSEVKLSCVELVVSHQVPPQVADREHSSPIYAEGTREIKYGADQNCCSCPTVVVGTRGARGMGPQQKNLWSSW